ncbi:hypothetical protein MKK88_03430, partial [Methylobacterium sp. E-005]|nr:hypothetical protein [Methylobacterium sp. E-005]
KPVALAAPAPAAGSLNGLTAVVKAMTDGIAACTAALKSPVTKAAPAPKAAAIPAPAPVTRNTALATVEKRARVAEIAGQVQKAPQRATQVRTVSGNEPHVPIETEAMRRRSRDDSVAAQRAAEKAATDRVMVAKSGAAVLTLRALDPSLSNNALVVLTHIIGRWQEADRRPVRVRASDASDATGLTTAQAQAALDELETKKATIAAINSVGTRLIQPGLGVAGA